MDAVDEHGMLHVLPTSNLELDQTMV